MTAAAPRDHRILPHTADAGLEASGPDLAATFEEAALALAELAGDIDPGALLALDAPTLPPLAAVRLDADDLVALAYAWLAELVARIDTDGALAAVEVEAVEARPAGGWRLRARVATLAFDGVRVRRAADVKAVTYHGLAVASDDDGWRLTAYLDV